MIGFGLYLLVVSIFDLKEKAVPWLFLASGSVLVAVGVVYSIFVGEMAWYHPLVGMIPGALLLLIARITEKMGCGDGFVLLMIGGVDGYMGSFVVLCMGSFFAALFCVVLLAVRKVKKHSRIPYIPFLTGAYFLCLGIFK
jgi:leader peptidase (prepilin peptidase)/N-methyltransferase